MTKRFHKHKLLLDENFPVRSYFPNLNGRIIVTYNIKDFAPLVENDTKSGAIGVSPSLSVDQIDKKLTALLNKSTKKSLLGKLTTISEET